MVSLQAALAVMVLSNPGQTVLLDFYADWCAPCRAMNPTVEALADRGYPVQRVNIDKNRPLAAKYGISSIPCFVMVVDGREVDRVVGGTSFSRLERMCKIGASAARPDPPPLLSANAPQPAVRPAAPRSPPDDRSVSTRWRGQQPSEQSPRPDAPLPNAEQWNRPAEPLNVIPVGNSTAPSASDDNLIAASVRLRVEDTDGHSCGSGTIVDARKGEALVLTCGHIFRDSKGNGRIDVDLFGRDGMRQVQGRLISYDLTRDVGLVVIQPEGAVNVARIAPTNYRLQSDTPVVSIGCNNGEYPTARHSRITSLDKFLGPPNIQVAGQPVEGRSGGGLFTTEGYLIGVCNAADPSDGEGLFAAPATIRAELDSAKLSFVHQPSSSPPISPVAATSQSAATLAAVAPPPLPESMPGVAESAPPPRSDELSDQEQAALDEIRRQLKDGAEVVCIIRPRNKPGAKSEVIMLDRASPEFLERLAAERRRQDGRHETSLEVPRPRRKLLEWTAPDGKPAEAPRESK